MGIRVNKLLGYGLTDVEPYEDPRINWNSPLVSGENPNEITVEKYQKFIQRREAEDAAACPERRNFRIESAFIRWGLNKGERFELTSTVTCDDGESENGAKVLVVRPLTERNWHRFDDMIDWMEESYLRYPGDDGNGYDRVDLFRGTIYPYHSYMDRRTGERLGGMIHEWVRMSHLVLPTPTDVPDVVLDEMARDIGFESHENAWANVVPEVPEAVRDVVEFGQLFNDSRTVLELRPMLYTFWR